jgi:hypothetical protein
MSELKKLVKLIGKNSAFEFVFMSDNIVTYESTLTYENNGNGFVQYVIEVIIDDGKTIFNKEPLSQLLNNHILTIDTIICNSEIRDTKYFKQYKQSNK